MIDENWENITKDADPELWDMLTNEKPDKKLIANNKKYDCLTDSDDDMDIDDNDIDFSAKKQENQSSLFPTVMHEKDGPSISVNQVVNVAPGEGQIPVSFKSEPDWEALCYIKEYPTAKNHFNVEREVPITVSKYIHVQVKKL